MLKSTKLILLAFWALVPVTPASAQIGGIGWNIKPLQFHVQSPTNAPQSQRYFVTNGFYHMLVYSSDGAFRVGNTTKPRTEQRFDPDYTSGIIQYQATLMAPANENSYCIFQIHTGDAQSRVFGATTFMAFWFTNFNGSLRAYSGTTLATNLGNQWFTLNCDHNLNSGIITVWINGSNVWQQADNGAGDFYFKDGVYVQSHHPTYQMDTYVTNVLIWTNLTASVFPGYYEIESANSLLAASVRGSPVTNGAAIVQSNFVVSADSLWYFVPTDSGYCRVMNVGSGLALAVQNSSMDSGALIVQQPRLTDGSADWLPGRNAANVATYTFTNRLSGKVLDVPGSAKSSNAQLDQSSFNGGANQKWLLIPCGNVVGNSVLSPALVPVFTNGNTVRL